MQFGKNHKVRHRLLTDKDEARAFIDFLEEERIRHLRECDFAKNAMDECIYYARDISPTYFKALARLYKSQIIRHNEDIEAIDNSIKEVKDRLGL